MYRSLFISSLTLLLLAILTIENHAATISVIDKTGQPVENAQISIANIGNQKIQSVTTNTEGEADFKTEKQTKTLSIFVAHAKHQGQEATVEISSDTASVRLSSTAGWGSTIFKTGTGAIPETKGEITVILDQTDRLFLFSEEWFIAGQKGGKLLTTRLGRKVSMTNSNGAAIELRVRQVRGATALIDYRILKPDGVKNTAQPTDNYGNLVVLNPNGKPVPGAEIYFVDRTKGTFLKGISDKDGKAAIESKRRAEVSVYCVHPEYRAFHMAKHDSAKKLRIRLVADSGIGSIVCETGTGNVPGLEGRLNPKLDTSNRTYLYGSNLALDGGKQQPVTFTLNRPIRAEDAKGNQFLLRVVDIVGRTSLLEYQAQ